MGRQLQSERDENATLEKPKVEAHDEIPETKQLESSRTTEKSEIQISENFKLIVGFLTGFTLLAIYSFMIFKMLFDNSLDIDDDQISTWKSIVTTIGGLISAVMVAIFTATPSNEPMFTKERIVFSVLITFFAAIWFLVGIITLFCGTLFFSGSTNFREITSFIGMSWLATAVAGTYAFLKLNPSDQ